MKYNKIENIFNKFLNKQEHWLGYSQYSKMRSYSWRTVDFFHHIELPLKNILENFKKDFTTRNQIIKKYDKKKTSNIINEEINSFKEEQISSKKSTKELYKLIKEINTTLNNKINTQEEHYKLKENITIQFQQFLNKFEKLNLLDTKLNHQSENIKENIDLLENKSITNFLKDKITFNKNTRRFKQ
jgi:hypothetical protein